MHELKEKSQDMRMIMITHDLGIVADFCERVLIFYTGQIVESGSVREIFCRPQTSRIPRGCSGPFRASTSSTDRLEAIEGMVPDAGQMPEGCHFHPRCPYRGGKRCRNAQAPGFDRSGRRGTELVTA